MFFFSALSVFHFFILNLHFRIFFGNKSLNFGGYSLGVTPLPIPNREVKPQNADGTACAGVWESRSLPRFYLQPLSILIGVFYFLDADLNEVKSVILNF